MQLSGSRAHIWLRQRRWLSVGIVGMVFVVYGVGLSACYALGHSRGHFDRFEGIPPVSALGDMMPEHAVFVFTFVVTALLVFAMVFLRSGQIDLHGYSRANFVAFCIAVAGLPFLILLAVLPMADYGQTVGYFHLASAGIGLSCFALYLEITAILALVMSCRSHHHSHPESSVPVWARNAAYISQLVLAVCGSLLFLTWILKLSETRSSLDPINGWEWAGLTVLFSALIPSFMYFAAHSEGQYRPLN